MDKRKMKFEFQMQEGPETHAPCIAQENGDWVATVEDKDTADELVKRWNAYQTLVDALIDCSAELFAQAADQKRAMHHVTEARALLNALKTQ